MKQILLVVALSLYSLCCRGAPAECDLKQFPVHWADAKSRVAWLSAYLETAEQKNSFAGTTVQSFRQALDICKAKREAAPNDTKAPANTGVVSQLKCEALLICSRLEAIDMLK